MRSLLRFFGPGIFTELQADSVPVLPPGSHKVIIIGETGVGKSTVINMITNFLRGGTLQQIKCAIPTAFYPKVTERFGFRHTESNIRNRSQAQTQKASEYKFAVGDSSFSLIDTPGLNDTNGMEQDEKNVEIIINAAIEANELSAVVLVLNGSEARITPNIKMLLTRLKGALPDSITENIVVVMTMCRADTCNFTDFSQIGIKPAAVVYMNNTAFSSDPKTWRGTAAEKFLGMEWDLSMQSCDSLLSSIGKLSKVSTNEFAKIKEIRSIIKQSLHNARLKVDEKQKLMDEIEKMKMTAQSASDEVEKSKNYTVQKTISVTEMVPCNYHSTICANCNYVCHDHCTLQETPKEANRSGLRSCACIGPNDRCTSCPGQCSYLDHYHDHFTISVVQKNVEEEIKDLKDKYLAAQSQQTTALSKLDESTLASKAVEDGISKLQTEIIQQCIELKGICKQFNLVDELYMFIEQLRQDTLSLKSIEARKTAETFIEQMEELADSFGEMDKDQMRKKFGVPEPQANEKGETPGVIPRLKKWLKK